MNNYKIYSLNEPNSDIVRYIGLTKNELKKRYEGHFSRVNNPSHKASWVKGLRNKGLRPSMILIEDGLTKEQALQKEIQYIKLFKV